MTWLSLTKDRDGAGKPNVLTMNHFHSHDADVDFKLSYYHIIRGCLKRD